MLEARAIIIRIGTSIIMLISIVLSTAKISSTIQSNPSFSQQNPVLEAFVFPNPIFRDQTAYLHVAPGPADTIQTHIYDMTGALIYNVRADEGDMKVWEGKILFEHKLNTSRFKSGQYLGVVTSYLNGKTADRRKFRFTLVR